MLPSSTHRSTLRASRALGALFVFGTSVAALGCGGDPVTTVDCPVDPALVAERSDCLSDDHCPCGTHCDLGICEASCSTNADCAEGERCDGFGRCRPVDESALVPSPSAEVTTASVQPLSPFVAVDAESGEGTLSLVATGGASGRMRILGREGVEVQCDGTWTDECEVTDVSPGAEPTVAIRYPEMPADGGPGNGRVGIFSDGGPHAVVSVTRRPTAAPGAPFEGASFEGTYGGAATLLTAGLGDAADPGRAPVGPLRVPMTAEIYGSPRAATLVLTNRQGALGNGPLIGTFALSDVGDGTYEGTATFPAHPFLEGDLGVGAEYAVIAETIEAQVRLRDRPRVLEVDLVQRFVGLGPNTQPVASWRIALGRTGDVGTAAPAIPTDATLATDPAALADAPTPWEARVAALFGPVATLVGQGHFWREASPVERTWEACFQSVDPRTIRAALALGLYNIRGYLDPAEAALRGAPDNVLWGESPIAAALKAALTSASTPPILVNAINQRSEFVTGFENRLPCEGSVDLSMSIGTEPLSANEPFDTCAHLRAVTGCTIEAPAAESTYPLDYQVFGIPSGSEFATGTIRWTRSCTLPAIPPECAASITCMAPDRSNDVPPVDQLEAPLGAVSGDATCALSGRSAAIGLDQLTDLASATARGAVDDCLADIARLRAAPPMRVPGGLLGEQLLGPAADPSAALLDLGTCIDTTRLLIAVQHGLGTIRGDADPSPVGAEAGAFALGRLARWLEVHAFIASETTSQRQMAGVLQGTPEELPPAAERLAQSLSGWDLLFHPRFADALGQLEAGALQEVDYRVPALGAAPGPRDAQGAGLPTAMLNTLAQQLELLAVVLEEAALDSDPAAAARVNEALPRIVLGGALAWGLYDRALAASPGELSWSGRFEAAEARALTALARAESRARILETGQNPLGIEDADLPLYFVAEGTAADGSFGPGGRYAAVSDFLLGTGPGENAWAPTLVRQAGEALASARAKFSAEADRGFRVAVATAEHQRWIDQVREQYDSQLFDYCGSIGGSPVSDPDFQAASCAIDFGNPACAMDPGPWYARWTEADVLGRVCVARAITTGDATGFVDARTRSFVDRCIPADAADRSATWDVVRVEPCGANTCLSCLADPGLGTLQLGNGAFELEPTVVPGTSPAMALTEIQPPTIRAGAVERCTAIYPGMRDEVPRPASAIDQPACVSGALGEAYLDVATASRGLETARAAHAELTEAYDIAMRSCTILSDTADEAQRLRSSHDSRMRNLIGARAIADSAAAVAGAAKDCLATIAGSDKTTPWGAISGGVATAGACIAGGFEAAANIASIGISAEIDNVQRGHEGELESLQEGSGVRICYNDALAELVGLRRSGLDIEQAAFDVQRAHASVDGLLADTQRVWSTGHHYLAEVEGSVVRPTGGDTWVDEDIETFTRRMRLARRATYLALRAVEFEQQQTLPARVDVFDASTPAELEAVLQELWISAGTRTVAGSRPSDLQVVLSLRDDILRVGDESHLPPEQRPLSAIERFRLALANPAHAVYDDAGQWLGQRIPFELIPMGTFGFDTRSVPIYAGNDCAERIWSVNASILGENVMSGTDVSFVRLDLLKRNTFFSQWCGEAPAGQPFQMASTRPTRNLFREPGDGETVGSDLGTEFAVTSDTRARLQAFLGVDRAGLEDPTYANGESSELAARGLFGEYALFIPASGIARESASGNYTTGLVLDRIDDVLLRLDYVSVAAR